MVIFQIWLIISLNAGIIFLVYNFNFHRCRLCVIFDVCFINAARSWFSTVPWIATIDYLIHTCISLKEPSEFSFFNSSCRIECSSSLTSSKSLDIKKEFKKDNWDHLSNSGIHQNLNWSIIYLWEVSSLHISTFGLACRLNNRVSATFIGASLSHLPLSKEYIVDSICAISSTV